MRRPVRPSVRYGIEVEGRHRGLRTVVLVGDVPREVAVAALAAQHPEHVYWETPKGKLDADLLTSLQLLVPRVSVEVDLDQLPEVARRSVEVVLRLPAAAARADTVKAYDGGFHVWHAPVQWRENNPSDYARDRQMWPVEEGQ